MDKLENKARAQTEEYVKTQMESFGASHDWWHIYRVRQTALKIASHEKARQDIVELSALLHDIVDYKYYAGTIAEGQEKVETFLRSVSIPQRDIQNIIDIIAHMSFSKGAACKSIEQACVQDADRLDGIGAIGIARCFHYAGEKNNPLFDPAAPRIGQVLEDYRKKGSPTAIAHFYDKLLKVKDKMITDTGKQLAGIRHRRITQFLADFIEEWQ